MIRSHGLCQACSSKELNPKKKDRITLCNVCHILPKRIYKSVATCRDNIVFLHESEHTVFDMYLDRMEFDKLETEFPFVWKYAVKKVLDMESRGMIKERGRLIIEIIDRYDRRKD